MKALTLLPKKIKKDYMIIRHNTHVAIHRPAYINVDFDKDFRIETNGVTWTIANSKVIVTLWKTELFFHVTVIIN